MARAGTGRRTPDEARGSPARGRRRERGDRERRERREAPRKPVVVGLLAAPGIAYELAQQLADEVPRLLRRRFPEVEWRVALRKEPMAAASQSDIDLEEVAHQRMLNEHWQLAICLTDYPVHVGNRPVVAHASAAYGVGLISVPALGAVKLDDRLRDAVVRLVEGLLGESVTDPEEAEESDRRERMQARLREMSAPVGRAEVHEDQTIQFVTHVGLGNLRLLIGMVRANRPWRLVAGLSRAVVGALGFAAFGIASPGIWIIVSGMGWDRLALMSFGVVVFTCVSLLAAHRLWERTYNPRPEARERVILFNLATLTTVAIGVVTMYLVLFVIDFGAAALVVTDAAYQKQLSRAPDFDVFLKLAALVTCLAMLGGALGAALEDDRTVREAAYGYNPDARTEALQEQGAADAAEEARQA
jgi:hypothetical protein